VCRQTTQTTQTTIRRKECKCKQHCRSHNFGMALSTSRGDSTMGCPCINELLAFPSESRKELKWHCTRSRLVRSEGVARCSYLCNVLFKRLLLRVVKLDNTWLVVFGTWILTRLGMALSIDTRRYNSDVDGTICGLHQQVVGGCRHNKYNGMGQYIAVTTS
jgi:hypothetical protein